MDEFPANSRKAGEGEARPKVERVVSGDVRRRRRGLGRRFKEVFIVGDARTTSEYVVFDVLIPAVRDMMFEAVEAGFRRMIYGETHRPHRGMPGGGYEDVGRVAYNKMSKTPTQTRQPQLSRQARSRFDLDDLVIPNRHDATAVVDQMFDILSQWGTISVADLYEMVGIESVHTDMKWGWTQLRGAKAVRLSLSLIHI